MISQHFWFSISIQWTLFSEPGDITRKFVPSRYWCDCHTYEISLWIKKEITLIFKDFTIPPNVKKEFRIHDSFLLLSLQTLHLSLMLVYKFVWQKLVLYNYNSCVHKSISAADYYEKINKLVRGLLVTGEQVEVRKLQSKRMFICSQLSEGMPQSLEVASADWLLLALWSWCVSFAWLGSGQPSVNRSCLV